MHPHGQHPRSHEGLAARLQSYEQRIRAFISQKVANIVQFAPISLATSNGLEDGLDGRPASQQSQRSARRVQHAGFRSRPPRNSQAVALQVEGGATKVVIVAEDDGVSVPLDNGEACLYSPEVPACRVFLDKNGKLTVTAATNQDVDINTSGTGNVVVNGGTLAVARQTDPATRNTPMTQWMAGIEAALAAASSPTVYPWATVSPTSNAIATISGGAAHFKG